jgi:hypothetical protein
MRDTGAIQLPWDESSFQDRGLARDKPFSANIGLRSGTRGRIIVPLLAAAPRVTEIGEHAFANTRITAVAIPRHFQILGSKWFHFHRFHSKLIPN